MAMMTARKCAAREAPMVARNARARKRREKRPPL